MNRVVWIVLGWLIFLATAQAASFDCAQASIKIERMICGNEELSALDSRMDKAYKDALGAYDYYAGLQVKSDQKKWLSKTRRACVDEGCLKRTYLSRIDELNAPFASRPYSVPNEVLSNVRVGTFTNNVLLIHNPNEEVEAFNRSLKRFKKDGVITQCRTLIDIPVGTAHGNHSYGGICTLSSDESTSDVLICNDRMVGHFQMTEIEKEISNQELADFVMANCFGG